MAENKILNREPFLATISKSLGRKMPTSVERPTYSTSPQLDVFKNHSQDELVEELCKQAGRNFTKVTVTNSKELPNIVKEMLMEYGDGTSMIWKDDRYENFGLTEVLKGAHVWDYKKGKQNINFAEKAKYAVAFSDITMAETATIVQYYNINHGISFSFLPENYICVIPKSTIVPRMTQATTKIHQQVVAGENITSLINFICGPSNSADIELNKVVGVHGPLRSSYIIVDDR